MSEIIRTKLGNFRRVTDGKRRWFLWRCPCGTWCNLSRDQMRGKVSVDHASMGCTQGYHETHDFGLELAAALTVAIMMPDLHAIQDEI
jgi:hypothetical protein